MYNGPDTFPAKNLKFFARYKIHTLEVIEAIIIPNVASILEAYPCVKELKKNGGAATATIAAISACKTLVSVIGFVFV